MSAQVAKQFTSVLEIYLDWVHKLPVIFCVSAPTLLIKGLDLCGGSGLLAAKLVARVSQDLEASARVLLNQRVEALEVHLGETSITREVGDDNGLFPVYCLAKGIDCLSVDVLAGDVPGAGGLALSELVIA